MSRKQTAIDEANKIDACIIEALVKGQNFLVEAGAGSGKTYSLIKVIEWLQENRWRHFKKYNQKVACITYTNAAVDVIQSRLLDNSFIVPSTIHSFAWQTMKQFQKELIAYIKDILEDKKDDFDLSIVRNIEYTLGKRYQDETTLYLYHDDVIKLFVKIIDNEKFRMFISSKYPVILIDEYQDSFKIIIDKFLEYFIAPNKKPLFGFFGDSWQTIYQFQGAVGEIHNDSLTVIKKKSNFRSAKKIVDMLNCIRPELPQISAEDEVEGSVAIVDCSDYMGPREQKGNFKDDLSLDEFISRLDQMKKIVCKEPSPKSKALILTHRLISGSNGYGQLFNLLDDSYTDKSDPFLMFFMNVVEPIYKGLESNYTKLIFDALGVRHYPIASIRDKKRWNKFFIDLKQARQDSVLNVLQVVRGSGFITFPEVVESIFDKYPENKDDAYQKGIVEQLMHLPYSQMISAIKYHLPNALFSTNHGVKGEEYDSVLFVVSKGWPQYNFDKYIPMSEADKNQNYPSYKRNRNLFYVCCSRAKVNFVMLITYPVSPQFKHYLQNMVGTENYFSYSNYVAKFGI